MRTGLMILSQEMTAMMNETYPGLTDNARNSYASVRVSRAEAVFV